MSAALSSRLLAKVSLVSPELRRKLWRKFYWALSSRYKNPNWTFMNYGFAAGPDSDPRAAADPVEFYSLQLYEKTLHDVELAGKDILEVGCGRGGGCFYVSQTREPKSALGIDFSDSSIELCIAHHASDVLTFQVGDAENLPCEDNSFDVVVNVESSHCYGDPGRFFREVHRVLRPGGHLVWTDFRDKHHVESTLQLMRGANLTLLHQEDITERVVEALNRTSPQKEATIKAGVPWLLRSAFHDFAGVRGARVYEALRKGEVAYVNCVLQKPQ